ncbi:helix-turn-helix domain-containing protein [Pseudoclavibacter helvolus]|uniref:helix-turn-helix domain-containing protein n=1 Tax=Pseudoclavibacter helvolus TaxID=255205 RepID=UPI003C760EE9
MADADRLGASADLIERDIYLDGPAAIDWVAALGWSVSPHSARLQIAADLIRTDTFAIGRIWHTPATLRFVGSADAPDDMFHSLLGIEGTHVLSSPNGQFELPPGQMYLQPFDERLDIAAREAAARVFFVARWGDLVARDGELPDARLGVFGAQSAHREIFANATHAALNSVTAVRGPGFRRVRDALGQLFASILADDAPARTRPLHGRAGQPAVSEQRAQSRSLLRRASKRIEAHASDVTFDVAKLARDLGVSSASLYRSYEESSMTPASQLRRVRARRARLLLDQASATESNTQDLKQIAHASGFGSIRAMRRALVDVPDHEPGAGAQHHPDRDASMA